MSKSTPTSARRLARAGLAAGVATAALVAATATSAQAASVPITLSSATGPSAGTPTITVTATTAFLSGVTEPVVTFSIPVCQTTYTSAASTSVTSITATAGNLIASPSAVRKLTDYKLAVTVPATVTLATPAPTTGSTKYNVCVYTSSTALAPQVGGGTYSVAAAAALTGVSPAAAPSVGGITITVSGTNLPTVAAGFLGLTVGGTAVPAANIKPVSSTGFTFVAPPHAPGTDVLIELITAAGPARFQTGFDYSNATIVSPNTASQAATGIDLDVLGSNFVSTSFTGAWNDVNGHVYLVSGVYNPATGPKVNGAIQECLDVFVISDTELICTMNLSSKLNNTGNVAATPRAAIIDVVSNGTAVITSATAAFTAADIGGLVVQTAGGDVGTEVPAGATIVSVQSATQATLSAVVATSVAALTVTVNGSRTALAATAASGGLTAVVGAPANTFSSYDVGRPISGTGIEVGTTITSVTGTTANLSRPTVGAVTTVDVGSASPVPDGTYTFTAVNSGAIGAQLLTGYQQSGISSGSTFTVAPY